jgi:hypothetical protein
LLGRSEHYEHENAMAAGHYLLAGHFFDRHEEYHKFMDLLQQPSRFNRFKSYVIDRDHFQTSSCGVNPSDVFPPVTATADSAD